MRQDISDYKMQMQTQRDSIVSRRGEDAEFKEKLGKKNRELAETMEELQVNFDHYFVYAFGSIIEENLGSSMPFKFNFSLVKKHIVTFGAI